jgi:hypothetical protein
MDLVGQGANRDLSQEMKVIASKPAVVRSRPRATRHGVVSHELPRSELTRHRAVIQTRRARSLQARLTNGVLALPAFRMGTRHGVAVHVHPPWGRPIAQTAGTGRRSSTSTLSTENPPSRSRSASSFPRSRARSGAEWRASQKR